MDPSLPCCARCSTVRPRAPTSGRTSILNHEPGDPPPSRGEFGHGPRYFRLESELATDFEMDDARRETLDGLTKAAGEAITVQADDLETIAKRLAAAGPV